MSTQVHFYENELVPQNQGGRGIGALQLTLVLLAVVIMVATAGPEPTDLVTFAILVLLEAILNGIKNSERRFSDSTVEKLAKLSDGQIATHVPAKYLKLAMLQVSELRQEIE